MPERRSRVNEMFWPTRLNNTRSSGTQAGADRASYGYRHARLRTLLFVGPLISLMLGSSLVVGQSATGQSNDVRLNSDSTTYDSHPSAASGPDGSTWVAWHSYAQSRDRIKLARFDSDGKLMHESIASPDDQVHGPPQIVVTGTDSVWVFWSMQESTTWRVVGRNWEDGQWSSIVDVSDPTQSSIQPSVCKLSSHRLMVVWSARTNGAESGFQIEARELNAGEWSDVRIVFSAADAFRPVVTQTKTGGLNGEPDVWVFWDYYDGTRYRVAGRTVGTVLGKIENVSPPEHHCLQPDVLATKSGVYVAWLRKQDVIGRPGIISQWHTLHVARRSSGSWQLIEDNAGDSAAAELTQGLVAQVEPRAVATGGYLGRRTAPMLVENAGVVWLLWERKSDHRGSTPNVVGDLAGRSIVDDRWTNAVQLDSGLVDYHLVKSWDQDSVPNQLTLVASDLPRNTRRVYHRRRIELNGADPLQQEAWTGWKPISLPHLAELPPRKQIQVEGTTYQLFWADMHCHTGLTSDAEGEHDELMQYARDRAKLDVVVFTNNDFLYDVPLTEYEFAMGNFFATAYSRPPSFLALPGYEWTSRIPGVRSARRDDPGNWTPPYQNRSFPNHRSVVFPPEGGPLLRYPEVANDIHALHPAVEQAGGITLTQHDAFEPSGHKVEVAMELTSGWRNYISRVPDLFHGALRQGHRLGFVACGDSHRRAPGLSGALTGIYAEELTSKSILEALKSRRCFATNGSRIYLDARANDQVMGQDVKVTSGSVQLSLRAVGTREIQSAVLFRDGEEVETFVGNGTKELLVAYEEDPAIQGVHWYYWRVSQQGGVPPQPGNLMAAFGHLAWSTPHWIVND